MADVKELGNNSGINRATGLLVIEVKDSNPNGDPDRESDPRQRPDGRGEISPVSFKRKLRDLVEDKEGPVRVALKNDLKMNDDECAVLESRGRNREEIRGELGDGGKAFKAKYWDGRIFGNTFLEEDSSTSVKTGAAHFTLGLSVAPIEIERLTNTNKAGVQEGKDRGMAPMGYRIVPHGLYVMPFFVNPTAAHKTGCTPTDVQLMLKLIPYAYAHTRSYVRPNVELLHAWYIEHTSPLGSCADFKLIEALSPKKTKDPDKPSASRHEYEIPSSLPPDLGEKVKSVVDLMNS